MASKVQRYCDKCGGMLSEDDFYSTYRTDKYADGKLNTCKKCITMHVNNYEPDTFKWILEECDVPFIQKNWFDLVERYGGSDPSKLTGMTILGRYLSSMKMAQYKKYRWADTEPLAEKAKLEKSAQMKMQGYDDEQIQAQLEIDAQIPKPAEMPANSPQAAGYIPLDEPDEFENSLTEEDKVYLKMKWGKTYRPSELVQLEQLYENMKASYDIQGAGHEDTLKMVCKTSLKANQLLDMGDVDGAQKMVKMYDQLMKSGKFTAAQNKGASGDFIDSLGELVAMCEKEGFIPRYYTDGPQDKVDRVLQDLQHYTKTLVTEELNLGVLIEQSMKQIAEQMQNDAVNDEADNAEDEDAFEEALFNDDIKSITTEDFQEFWDLEEEAEEDDEAYINSVLKGDK